MFGRVILNVLGTLFLLLGVLGLALPLLPATPFLLLASACYVRGSKTLHTWLMNNRYLGTYIKNIRDKRGMPMRAKVITVMVLWISLLLSIYRLESLLLDITLLLVGVGVTTLIFKLETVQQN